MAADILLYKPDIIPVGLDQKQHLELMSSIAQRFNQKHDYFKIPKEHISSIPKVMSLIDPTKKMSKSDNNLGATIFLNDSEESIIKKFKKATTDSLTTIEYSLDQERAGVKNMIDIYSAFSDKSIKEVLAMFDNKQYGHLKKETGELVSQKLNPIRTKINELESNKEYLKEILKNGNEIAKKEASSNIKEIMKIMGFLDI
jgi:tryptophanyl-tRNA synthetase